MENFSVHHKEQAEAVVALLKDIRLEELTPKEVDEIFHTSLNYNITLYASSEI